MVDLLRKSSFLLFKKLHFCTMTPTESTPIGVLFSLAPPPVPAPAPLALCRLQREARLTGRMRFCFAKFGRLDRKHFSSTWLACETSLLITGCRCKSFSFFAAFLHSPTPHPLPRPRSRGLLAAARSRSCSNSPPDCYSLHSRRFATLAPPMGNNGVFQPFATFPLLEKITFLRFCFLAAFENSTFR